MQELQTKIPRSKAIRDRYIIEDLLGQGGFGAVYKVRDRRVKGNVFALKEVVDPDRHQRESFAFEGEILKRLDHQSLPRVYRVFEDTKHNRVCMLMDYIEGPNLEQLRLQQLDKRFSLPQVLRMMRPIIDAIIYLHAQNPPIIHRDIKPANIIIPISGEGSVLVDFGIAKEYDKDSTTTAIRHCSPGYGAPEQYIRDTSTRTDIYGIAATFYTLLTGEVPIEALYRITRLSGNRPDPLLSVHELVQDVPQDVSDAINCAMAVNSNDRFATVEEFWRILAAHHVENEEKQVATTPVSTPVVLKGDISDRDVDLVLDAATVVIDNTPPVFPPVTPLPVGSVAQETKREKKKNVQTIYSLVALALVGLLIGISLGTYTLTRAQQSTSLTVHATTKISTEVSKGRTALPQKHTPVAQVQTPVSQATSAPTSQPATQQASVPTPQVSTPTPGLQPTPTPSPVSTSQPTPTSGSSSGFPALASEYNGTIHNTPASVQSSLSLSPFRQQQSTISGYLTLGPGLIGNGNFNGTITSSGSVEFLVPESGGFLDLFFQGQVASDGSISGTYCSYQNGQCDESAPHGYGSWNVRP